MSEEWKTFLHSNGVPPNRTTAHRPQSNGQVEKLNATPWGTVLAAQSKIDS